MLDRNIHADIAGLREQMERANSAEERVMLDFILRDRQADLELSLIRRGDRCLPPGRGGH
ncbi:hypothetical protein [Sphingomonas gellani]|uniref:hypothetical protein n=1 Tax=Sphingomonas gellani TaxID=1166340 RepID=UPI000B8A24C9|nr:hypothetical protein [Sphingomonas gellani]